MSEDDDRLLTIPVGGNQYIDVDLTRLFAPPVPHEEAVDFEFLLQVLGDERPPPTYWLRVAAYCASSGHKDEAEAVARRGIDLFARSSHPGAQPEPELVSLYNLLASLALSRAREAPTNVLPDASFKKLDPHSNPTRANLLLEADAAVRQAESIIQRARRPLPGHKDPYAYARSLTELSRGVTILFRGGYEPAMRCFDSVLSRQPHHVIALLGKGCLLLRRKSYTEALAIYQAALHVYLAKGLSGPDPRIGVGLCFWGLGHLDAARRAWRRCLTLDTTNHSALTLLGLSSLHLFKSNQPILPDGGEEESLRQDYYTEGIRLLSQAFHLNQRKAITAVALAQHFIAKVTLVISSGLLTESSDSHWQSVRDMLTRALTLGETAVQYADASRSSIQARLQYARSLHIMSYVPGGVMRLRPTAQRFYTSVLEECTRLALARSSGAAAGTVATKDIPPPEALAAVGLAQIQISTGSTSAAKETLLKYTTKAMTAGSTGVEILLLAAALRARHAHNAEPRTMLERALKVIEAAQEQVEPSHDTLPAGQGLLFSTSRSQDKVPWQGERLHKSALRAISDLGAQDPFLFIDLAQIAQIQDPALASRSYASALRHLKKRILTSKEQQVAHIVRANLGALLALQGQELEGQDKAPFFSTAITEIKGVLAEVSQNKDDFIRIVSHYNLARSYELANQREEAQRTYEDLLQTHPEYVDAKVRLAILHSADRSGREEAYTLFRECIQSAPANLDARIAYAVFLAGELPGSPSNVNWTSLRDFLAEPLKPPEMGASTFGSRQAATEVQGKARRDGASLAALGWTYYQTILAQRSKPLPKGQTPEQAKTERTKGLFRAVDLFDRAIAVDKHCAFAAQGLAILLTEDVFEVAERGTVALEERYRRNADEAISILSKVREVRSDASVHICIGHALMRKKEYSRALKSYELAESLFHPTGVTLSSLLQSLARAEYAEGLSIRSPAHLARAINYLIRAQRQLKDINTTATRLQADWVSYNEAVLRQRLLVLLHDVNLSYRTADEIRAAIDGMKQSMEALTSLLPRASARHLSHITTDIIQQRIAFVTDTLLPQAKADLEHQVIHEDRERTKLQAAEQTRLERQRLQEERQREAEADRQRRAEELTRRREVAKEQLNETLDWSVLDAVGQEKKTQRKKEKGSKKSRRKGGRRGGEEGEDEDEAEVPEGEMSEGSDLFDSGASDQEGDEETQEAKRQRKATAALAQIKKSNKKKTSRGKDQSKGAGKGRGKRRGRKVQSGSSGEEEDKEDDPPELNDDTENSASDSDTRPKKRARRQAQQVMDDDDMIDSDEEV